MNLKEFGQSVKSKYPQYSGVSDEELANKVLEKYPEYRNRITPEEKGLGDSIAEVGKERFQDTLKSVERMQTGEQSAAETVLQTAGNIAGGLTEAAMKTVGAGISKLGDITGLKEPIKNIGSQILQTPIGQSALKALQGGVNKYEEWKAKNPRAAENIEAVVDIASFIPVAKGTESAVKGVAQGAKTIKNEVMSVAKPIFAKSAEIGGKAFDSAKTVGGSIIDSASRLPSNFATNVAAKKARIDAIKSLPTKTAQLAAKDGVDIEDIKYIYNLPKSVKPAAKELVQSVKNFSAGATTENPIEVVGKPIIASIKIADKKASEVGKKLGTVAKNLGSVSREKASPAIMKELQKIQGLSGLRVKNGVLDFKNTVLATGETASDRNAIQGIFSAAIKSDSGVSKHLLRQELFESLGGKKLAKVSLTGTQEKAYEAVRRGLLKVLDSVDSSGRYAKYNTEYAKISAPLEELRKFMKSVSGADEDILNMNAGLLARRLTGNSMSNPQVRAILRSLDKITEGTTATKTEALQDLYNLLEKYYDITGKTSFKGGITAGVEAATGFNEAVGKVAAQILPTQRTQDVVIKAIERALEEATSG